MSFALLVTTVVLSLLLGLYVFLRYEDLAAGGVAVVIAAAAAGVWFFAEADKEDVESELLAARERVAVLEAAPARRGFTPEARKAMVESLSQFIGPTAFVLANSTDLETTQYSREIVAILKDAGWEVPPSFGVTYRPVLLPGQESVPPGVVLGISSDVPEAFASSIFNAFRAGGVNVRRGPHWPGTEHPISILVGPKAPV